MASRKNLKKDIDFLISLVISDCFMVMEQNSKVNNEAILEIVSEIIVEHRNLRIRACRPDGKSNPALVKQHYKKLVEDLLATADVAFEKLSAEIKKVA
jgi:hypothetical protein